MKKLSEGITLEELIESMSKKELAVLLMGIGSSLIGYVIIGVIMALLE